MNAPPLFSVIVSISLLTVMVAGCADGSPDAPIVFADIHGLAVDPNDPRVLYVATHHGLFRGVNDAEWSKVSKETMDFMGFTTHPTQPDVMYASGHPAQPTIDYHSLGVVKSTDGGVDWETVALRNQVDFHAMTISLASPDTVWGWFYRDNHFYESTDGGLTWDDWAPEGAPSRVQGLAGSASNSSVVYAAAEGGIHVSTDAGRSWGLLSGDAPAGAATVVATTKGDSETIWAFFPSTGFARSDDAGRNWTAAAPISWGAQDGPAALAIDPTDPAMVYAASGRGAIYKTTDKGGSWSLVRAVGAGGAH